MSFARPFRLSPSPAHILLVESDGRAARSIHDQLALTADWQVAVTPTGREALACLEEARQAGSRRFDLVVVAMTLPDMSGLELVRWLRQQEAFQALPTIVLTNAFERREVVEALTAGANDYLLKPVYPQELLTRVQSWLRPAGLEQYVQRQRRQLSMLNRVAVRLWTSLELRDLLEGAVEGVGELLEATYALIYMHDRGHNVLRYQQGWSQSGVWPTAPPAQVAPDDGVLGSAFASRRLVQLEAESSEARLRPVGLGPAGFPVESGLAAPLFIRGRPVGVAVVFGKQAAASFDATDHDLFLSFIGMLSPAIENAWLFNNLKQRQQELLESRNILQSLIDGILHPIYTIGPHWQVVSANHTRLHSLGLEPEQIIGQACYQIFFQRDAPCEHCLAHAAFQTGQPQRWLVRWLEADYLPQEWDVTAYPIPASRLPGVNVAIVWQDRTEERRLENSLFQASKLSALGQLAAGVAHEINNPLTVISTSAQMLRDNITPEDEAADLVDWIMRANARALQVVRGLLDFARPSRLLLQAVDLNASLEEALTLVRYQLHKVDIQVIENMAPDLPAVVGSWEHLKTVWLNLLLNARDALLERPDNRELEIVTRLSPLQNHIQVVVRDNGCGMTEEEMARIFEPFFTTKAPGKGTGLGLATSHRIIEQHGGEINVTSRKDEGTVFVVRLPLAEKSAPAQAEAAAPVVEPAEPEIPLGVV